MDRKLASIFCDLNSDFKMEEGGVLYLKCLKALYGHIEAARLFYDDVDFSFIKGMKFFRNQYDPCVYNQRNEEGDLVTIQVTQPLGYVGTLPAIRINESTAEWTARDCYV
jgi:hypothetical protein